MAGAVKSLTVLDGRVQSASGGLIDLADIGAAAQASLTAAATGFGAENKAAATIPAGAPVAVHGSGTGVRLADAATAGRECVGLASATTAVGFSADVRTGGLLTLADWSAVTDEAAVTLAARGVYYLSATPGKITTTPPATTGQRVQPVGAAVSADTLAVSILQPVLL